MAGFDGFFRSDFPRLVAFLCAGGLGPGTAREVAVEAFVQETGTWPPPGDPRVAVRLTAVRLAAEQTWFDGGAPTADPPGDRLTSVVERNARGVELLSTLPETQRTVLTWSLDGFSPAAIASALGMAGTTVRSNLRHARERLKQRLGLAGREEALMTELREAEAALVNALRSALDVEEALTRVKTAATALAAPRVPVEPIRLRRPGARRGRRRSGRGAGPAGRGTAADRALLPGPVRRRRRIFLRGRCGAGSLPGAADRAPRLSASRTAVSRFRLRDRAAQSG